MNMNIGKIMLMLVLIFAVPFVAAADLQITLDEYSPQPVIPGTFFTVTFDVRNTAVGDVTADLTLDVNDPFFIEGSDDKTITIATGATEEVTFTVGVESNANSGFESIDLDWDTGVGIDDGTETFSIQIKAIETTLVVQSVSSNPNEIAPGEDAIVTIKIRNDANIILKNIKVKLNLDSAELPFAPVGSITERNVDTLNAGSLRSLDFGIVALTNAASQVYKVPLTITYFDEFGEEFVTNDLISLTVGGKPTLSVNLDGAKLIEGKTGKISLEIVNRGLTDAKFLTVVVSSSPHYEILGTRSVYIGDVDSDDVESLDFEIITGTQGYVEVPVQITYRDANNNAYTESFNLQTKIYSVEEAKQIGLIQTSYNGIIAAVVAFIVILYFVLRKIFARKRQRL